MSQQNIGEPVALSNFVAAGRGKKPSKVIFIGNPPYHEEDGGYGKSARPIYHRFVEKAMEEGDESLFIIPARWYAGGKGLDDFRSEILNSGKVKQIVDFPICAAVFPTVEISGGVCFLHTSKSHCGPCVFTDKNGDAMRVDLALFDIVVRDPRSISVVQKVLAAHKDSFLSESVSSLKPFGLRTFFKDFSEKSSKTIPCRTMHGDFEVETTKITRGHDLIPFWKVITTRAAPGRDGRGAEQRKVLSSIACLPPNHICLETYLVVRTFQTKIEARNCEAYLKLRFPRFLLNPRMTSQDISKDKFAWVPVMDFTRSWTDEQLYDYFGLTEDERAFVEMNIRFWEW